MPIIALQQIAFSASNSKDTGTVTEACINNVVLHQNQVNLYLSDIFIVDHATGRVNIGPNIYGGHHGTLDFEANPLYGFVVTVTDSSGATAQISIRVQLLDVNEPPLLLKLCPKDQSLIACPDIPENRNLNLQFDSFTHSMQYSNRNYLRIYTPDEATRYGSTTLLDGKLVFNGDGGTSSAVWDIILTDEAGAVGFHETKRFRLAYDNTGTCFHKCELHVEIDGMLMDTTIGLHATSFITFSDLFTATFSNRLDYSFRHNIGLAWKGSGEGPSILYLELIEGLYERLYSASSANEQIDVTDCIVETDNTFSPRHFYRYLENVSL